MQFPGKILVKYQINLVCVKYFLKILFQVPTDLKFRWTIPQTFGETFEAIFFKKKAVCQIFWWIYYLLDFWWKFWSDFLQGKSGASIFCWIFYLLDFWWNFWNDFRQEKSGASIFWWIYLPDIWFHQTGRFIDKIEVLARKLKFKSRNPKKNFF